MNFVLYHANCYDGMGSYYAAWKKFGNEAQYFAVNYGEDPPVMVAPPGEDENVYILDFSYSAAIIRDMAEVYDKIVILDHHKTAEADLKDLNLPNVEVVFDMERSGAVISWTYFHPGEPLPELLMFIQDRDLWRFRLFGSKAVCAAMKIYPFNIDVWDGLIIGGKATILNLMAEGKAIIEYEDNHIEKFCKEAVWGTIGGYDVPIINISTMFSDATAALLTKNPQAPFAAYFYVKSNNTVHFGLRSKGDMDVSAVCKLYGGGGHKNAAGFVSTLECLSNILE